MARRNQIVSLAAACVLGLGSHSMATVWGLSANLDGLQEVPPNASPAFGVADLTLDDSTNTISITSGIYQDLLGGATSVLISDAPIGSNGPLVKLLTLDTPGAASGTFSGGGVITAAQTTDMLAGNTYFNVRSQVFPSGEIRGQISVVPEPTCFTLAAIAATGLVFRRPRRKVILA
jgi:hypothetical protein